MKTVALRLVAGYSLGTRSLAVTIRGTQPDGWQGGVKVRASLPTAKSSIGLGHGRPMLAHGRSRRGNVGPQLARWR
jgi:hypothetical protein